MRNLLILSLLFLTLICCGAKRDVGVGLNDLKPERNATWHNNVALRYREEGNFTAAIQEFKIAISLNPNTQATAVYYNNLGETYLLLGYPHYAQDCFERAIKIYPLNFKYYQNIVETYRIRGILDYKIKHYQNSGNTLDAIPLGLIYVAKGNPQKGIIILDEFVMNEPKLLITDGVKMYLKELIKLQKAGMLSR